MNENQRETLVACLAQIFGPVEDSFVDAAVPLLEWIELGGGETLFEEGDPENGVYFVISGRLRVFVGRTGEPRFVGEIGRGETVGEMAVLTGDPRSATLRAIRNTVLAHATREVFEELWKQNPQLPVHMAKIIIDRLRREKERPKASRPATVCLIAITSGIDTRDFAEQLSGQLTRWGTATLVSSAEIDGRFGDGASQATREPSTTDDEIARWLDDVEMWNEFVLFVADDGETEWTRRCLRHADEVLLLANANEPVETHEVERALLVGDGALTRARQVLVLIHPNDGAPPRNTSAWLDRHHVDAHVHVRRDLPRDMSRLARIVSRNAIGFVLGGGGARGFAHLGAYKALEELGIDIDFVAGTSIGAAMAAYISFDLRADVAIDRARRVFAKNPTGDLNVIPLHSLVVGGRLKKAIDRGVADTFGDGADVTDTWRTLRCVATNFSQAAEQVIARGPAGRAVRASVSIPVALPSVPWDGDLLVDGGVFNNFPASTMLDLGACRIIGVDLAQKSARKVPFDEVPGPFKLLVDRFRGRKNRRYKLPGLGAVLMQTMILYSESRREEAKHSVDIYLNPVIRGIGLLEWTAFDKIVDIGYQHAREVLAGMSDAELAAYRNP